MGCCQTTGSPSNGKKSGRKAPRRVEEIDLVDANSFHDTSPSRSLVLQGEPGRRFLPNEPSVSVGSSMDPQPSTEGEESTRPSAQPSHELEEASLEVWEDTPSSQRAPSPAEFDAENPLGAECLSRQKEHSSPSTASPGASCEEAVAAVDTELLGGCLSARHFHLKHQQERYDAAAEAIRRQDEFLRKQNYEMLAGRDNESEASQSAPSGPPASSSTTSDEPPDESSALEDEAMMSIGGYLSTRELEEHNQRLDQLDTILEGLGRGAPTDSKRTRHILVSSWLTALPLEPPVPLPSESDSSSHKSDLFDTIEEREQKPNQNKN